VQLQACAWEWDDEPTGYGNEEEAGRRQFAASRARPAGRPAGYYQKMGRLEEAKGKTEKRGKKQAHMMRFLLLPAISQIFFLVHRIHAFTNTHPCGLQAKMASFCT
jgi:hypothetical protein